MQLKNVVIAWHIELVSNSKETTINLLRLEMRKIYVMRIDSTTELHGTIWLLSQKTSIEPMLLCTSQIMFYTR
jgi:hypothetical protein